MHTCSFRFDSEEDARKFIIAVASCAANGETPVAQDGLTSQKMILRGLEGLHHDGDEMCWVVDFRVELMDEPMDVPITLN